MAIAKYFSKNALAIQHILKKGNYTEFENLLNSHVIEIAFDNMVLTHEGKTCFDLLIKLVARLYPKVIFTALHPSLESHVKQAEEFAKKINSQIEISEKATVRVCIGNTIVEPLDDVKTFYVGSSKWTVLLSDSNPVGSGASQIPFAAGVAACIAAANIFRFVFFKMLRKAVLDDEVRFSLLEPYRIMDPEDCQDLGKFTLVGLGAIGNGCLWALSHLPGVKGELIAIDHQKIALSNIQRYVQVLESDQNIQKIIISKRSIKNSLINATHFIKKWDQYISESKDYNNEVIITALDTAKDRIAVQSSLPKYLFNGYTDDGMLGVARHLNLLNEACLNCMYTPKGPRPNISEVIAQDLNIPEISIRNLIYLNKAVDINLLSAVAISNKIDVKEIIKFKGTSILDFYSEFICGGILLKIQGAASSSSQTIEAPLAFQSSLAGILLITDLYLFRCNNHPIYNRSHYNPLVPIKKGINFTHHNIEKDNSGNCICSDPIYRQVYQNKWFNNDA
jgi:hypothetical protein